MVAADDAAAKAAGGKRITPAAKKTTSTPVAEGSAQSFDDNRGLLGAEDSGSRSQQPSGTTTGVAKATNTVAKKAPPTGQSKAATASAIISSLTNKRMAGAELKSSSATTRLAGSESSVQGGMLAPASMIESTRPRQAAQGSARPAAERAAETSRSAGRQSQQQQRVASVAPTAGNVPRRGQAASVQPQQQQQRGNNNAQAAGATTTRTPIPGVRQLAAAKGTSHAGGAAASLGDSAARNGALASPLAQPLRQLQPSNKMPSTSKALRTLAANSSLLRRVVPSGSAKSAAPVPLAAKRAQATVAKTTANSQREQQQPSLRRTLLNANSPQRAINAKKHSIVSQKLNSQKVIKTSEALASGHSQTRSYRANQSAILPTATSKQPQPQQQQYRHSSRSSHSSASASKTASSQAKSKNRTINTINTNNNNKTITNTKMADQAVIDKLEAGFAKLQAATPEQCHSLLKKYLTREVLDQLKTRKTAMGATLLDVAQSGFENLDSGVGIYAPDAESYTLFAELFNPIIEDYHGGFKPTDKHPASDFGDLDSLVNVDPTNEYVISTRVRCGRSLQGYPFNPCLTEAQYKEMESKVSSTLKEMQGDLAGTYYPLTGMTKETQQQLIDDHFLFKEGDRFLQAANACRYWPTGRGIYHNEAKSFLVWVNEEDHLRIISMQKGGDLKTIFSRMVRGVRAIEAKVPFSRDDRLGFLTFCPTNLGTTIRASVHIKLPKLAADRKKLEEVASKFNLQVRGTSGEHTESVGGVYDISNKRRLGLTEYQAVREMQDGILELIKIEKSL